MTCGDPGKWRINYELSPNNANPWTATVVNNVAGYSADAPYLASKTQSGCSRPNDIKSGCDGRVMYANITCNSYIRNVTFTFTADIINYDCINGACVNKTTYNTPGIYTSLSACEEACGTGCSGKCISNSDWAQIEGLASQLRNRNCN